MSGTPSPTVFISYSWSSEDREEWVLRLATELFENGVQAVLDKWDLRPGEDAAHFMERMVNDPSVTKVIMVCDRAYKEKADARRGGAGTEAQILSAELYGRRENNKVCGVVAERDEAGRPYLPTYYASRIYIDMSDETERTDRFEELLRWVFDKPLLVRPPLGRKPAYIDDGSDPLDLQTSTRARRASDALRGHKPYWKEALQEYGACLLDGFERLRIKPGNDFPERFKESIASFTPYRNEALQLVARVSAHDLGTEAHQAIHRLFEGALRYTTFPDGVSSYSENEYDNYRFIIYELYLLTVAHALKAENFALANFVINQPYYSAELARLTGETMVPFTILQSQGIQTIDALNHRYPPVKMAPRAYLVGSRLDGTGLKVVDVQQADLVLALVARRIQGAHAYWWPDTLILSPARQALPVFARSRSKAYFLRLHEMLKLSNEQLTQMVAEIDREGGFFRGIAFIGPNVSVLVGLPSLCSAP